MKAETLSNDNANNCNTNQSQVKSVTTIFISSIPLPWTGVLMV